jgi:hypothetical protein
VQAGAGGKAGVFNSRAGPPPARVDLHAAAGLMGLSSLNILGLACAVGLGGGVMAAGLEVPLLSSISSSAIFSFSALYSPFGVAT